MSRANGKSAGGGARSAGPGVRCARRLPVRFDISSDYSASRDVQKQILQRVRERGYPDRHAYAIQLALDEALINAIKHGNKMDPAKHVHVRAAIGPRQARITVEDEGAGFRRRTIPDPTCEPNRCKLHGRGILLMESYMDSVRFSHGGRRVVMVKKNK